MNFKSECGGPYLGNCSECGGTVEFEDGVLCCTEDACEWNSLTESDFEIPTAGN